MPMRARPRPCAPTRAHTCDVDDKWVRGALGGSRGAAAAGGVVEVQALAGLHGGWVQVGTGRKRQEATRDRTPTASTIPAHPQPPLCGLASSIEPRLAGVGN